MSRATQASFNIDLESDRARAQVALDQLLRPESALNSSGMKVLLVDDDVADTLLIQRALQRHPHVSDVVARNSPTRTLMEISAGRLRPALVFLDISMPGIDGFQFLEAMRKMRKMGEVPVVFITSSAFVRDVGRAIRSSACGYIVKPESFEELEKQIDQAIRRAGSAVN
jgi:DNA-binding response OmpR family regulator